MKKIRMIYQTSGVARFISHLDLNRLMQYALRRSDLPVWYTEGFHQHLYLTFSNPLSLGYINQYGIMEIKLTDDAFDTPSAAAVLNACLPESICAVESYESDRPFSEIAFSDYSITLQTDDPAALISGFHAPTLPAVKRGKAGEYTIDLAPHIACLQIRQEGDGLLIDLRLPASQECSINPGLLLDTVATVAGVSCKNAVVTRTCLLDKEGKKFR